MKTGCKNVCVCIVTCTFSLYTLKLTGDISLLLFSSHSYTTAVLSLIFKKNSIFELFNIHIFDRHFLLEAVAWKMNYLTPVKPNTLELGKHTCSLLTHTCSKALCRLLGPESMSTDELCCPKKDSFIANKLLLHGVRSHTWRVMTPPLNMKHIDSTASNCLGAIWICWS